MQASVYASTWFTEHLIVLKQYSVHSSCLTEATCNGRTVSGTTILPIYLLLIVKCTHRKCRYGILVQNMHCIFHIVHPIRGRDWGTIHHLSFTNHGEIRHTFSLRFANQFPLNRVTLVKSLLPQKYNYGTVKTCWLRLPVFFHSMAHILIRIMMIIVV